MHSGARVRANKTNWAPVAFALGKLITTDLARNNPVWKGRHNRGGNSTAYRRNISIQLGEYKPFTCIASPWIRASHQTGNAIKQKPPAPAAPSQSRLGQVVNQSKYAIQWKEWQASKRASVGNTWRTQACSTGASARLVVRFARATQIRLEVLLDDAAASGMRPLPVCLWITIPGRSEKDAIIA